MLTALGLAAATLVSEDLACVTAGLLIQRGEIDPVTGIVACALGIFVGDCGLWVVGCLGRRVAWMLPRFGRWFAAHRVERLRAAVERHAGAAIVASRFTPGTRLPLYLAAGWIGVSPVRFAAWTLMAASVWTPAIVLTTAGAGHVAQGAIARPVAASVLAGVAILGLLYASRVLSARPRRRRLAASIARWKRWEFWPMWLFYPPVGAWVAWLAIRHGGLTTITAANPGIPDGGTVGESKFDILSHLPAAYTVPSALVPAGGTSTRLCQARAVIAERAWSYPLVAKPDVGQRGGGVRLVSTREQLAQYLSEVPGDVVLQPYHDGPYEAGVFYYRFPGTPRGRILSITDKHFPFVVGDGQSTLEELIWNHPRHRLQGLIFLRRHRPAAARILSSGERFRLALAGNHAQGTVFRDGSHLRTEALERRIDEIARAYPGFFIGRFDIRYRDVEAFKAGNDLAIVELNGATSESTVIYDPDRSLLAAYRQLFEQWSLVFTIGALNRAQGTPVSSLRRLIALVRTHLAAPVPLLSD